MKVRSSKAFLVIGSAHLGIDMEIVEVYAQVAKHYKAQAIHLGPLTDKAEFEDFHRLIGKPNKDAKRAARSLQARETQVIDAIMSAFGKLTVVTAPGQHITPLNNAGLTVVQNELKIGRHLGLSAIPPTGDKVTAAPISVKARNYYKAKGSSWILPHPTPAVESYEREGLNQAWNYFTTGSLRSPEAPLSASDMYLSYNLPCAILVILDKDNEEFHARPLHIDYVRNDVSHRIEPVVCDDGLAFTRHEIIEVGSEDKACHITDAHGPYQHLGVLAAVRTQNELHQPSVYVDGGDTSDMEPVSRHTKEIPGAREGLRLRPALADLRWFLDACTNVKSIKLKVQLDSNHHEWLSQFVEDNPCLKGWLDWPTISKEWFPDWVWYLRTAGGDKTFKFHDYSIRHGDRETINKAWEVFIKYLGGHYHKHRVMGRAFSNGPACRLGPKYLQNGITAWQNQMASLTAYKGKASVAPKTVFHDEEKKRSRFCYQNVIYEVEFFQKTESTLPK